MGERRRGREFALQILFQIDMGGSEIAEATSTFWEGKRVTIEARRFAESLAQGTIAHLTEIDARLREGLVHWRLPRIAAVDRSVLRMAVYELLHEKETPPVVVIDEAIELAKRYGGEESGLFVNGVLDGIRKRLAAPGPAAESSAGSSKT
jgi:transcription antitermination protein NusB